MLKTIRSINLQAHEDVTIELPKTGLVRFRGENNEGKSVITKVINDVVSCRLHVKSVRNPLINYDCEEGQLVLTKWDGKILFVNINREASKTFYELLRPGQPVLRRYLSDKVDTLRTMISDFGFHYSPDREVSLNIYNTYDPLLFLTTSTRTNYDVLESAISDPYALRALDGVEKAIKDTDAAYKQMEVLLVQSEAKLSSLTVWDINEQTEKKKALDFLLHTISMMETPNLISVERLPDLSIIDLLDSSKVSDSISNMSVVRGEVEEILKSIDAIKEIISNGEDVLETTILEDAIDYNDFSKSLSEHTCPTCGRSYSIEHELQHQ